MKKIISFFVSMCLLITVCSAGFMTISASAAEKIDGTEVTWSFDNISKTLTFDGTGAIPDFDKYQDEDGNSLLPWADITFTKVAFGSGITGIGNYAFYRSISLEEITVPQSITSIGKGAFLNCKALKEVKIESVLVKKLADSIFSACSTLKSVTLPHTVEEIEQKAFYKCSSLEEISMPENLASVGDAAFNSCTSLKTFTANEKLEKIGARAFYCCEELEKVTLSESTTSIGNSAFDGCEKLTSIALSAGTPTVPIGAFSGCSKLAEVLIPEGLQKIESDAFNLCPSLKAVTIPFSVTEIGTKALGYASGGKAVEGFTITGYDDSTAEEYAIGNGFKFNSLGDYYARSGKISETLSWEITDDDVLVFTGTGGIGDYSVYNLPPYMHSPFDTVELNDGITSIGDYAFFGDFVSFYIPSSVTHIGKRAVGYTFDENGKIAESADFTLVFTQDNAVAAEYASENGFFSYKIIFNGECGDHTNWSYDIDSKILTISGTGFICDNFGSELPCINYADWPVGKIIIKEGIESINENALAYVYPTDDGITVCIPKSVTHIAPMSVGYYLYTYIENDEVQSAYEIEDCTIMGYAGSEAEKYADENGFEFIELDEETIALMKPDSDIEFKLNEGAPLTIDEENKTIQLYTTEINLESLLAYFTIGKDVTVKVDKLAQGEKLIVTCSGKTLCEYTIIFMGDTNDDGKINSTDALNILRHSVGDITLTGVNTISADLNGSGNINSQDALEILLVSVGQKKLEDYMKTEGGTEDGKTEDNKTDDGNTEDGKDTPTDSTDEAQGDSNAKNETEAESSESK